MLRSAEGCRLPWHAREPSAQLTRVVGQFRSEWPRPAIMTSEASQAHQSLNPSPRSAILSLRAFKAAGDLGTQQSLKGTSRRRDCALDRHQERWASGGRGRITYETQSTASSEPDRAMPTCREHAGSRVAAIRMANPFSVPLQASAGRKLTTLAAPGGKVATAFDRAELEAPCVRNTRQHLANSLARAAQPCVGLRDRRKVLTRSQPGDFAPWPSRPPDVQLLHASAATWHYQVRRSAHRCARADSFANARSQQ